MRRLVLPLLMVIALLAVLARGERADGRADFVFINHGDANTLDPQRMSWMQELRIGRCLFEGLVRTNVLKPDYPIEPACADRWEVSPDALTYTFHIRDGARWSDGDPVTSRDFLYSWRRALLAELGCDYLRQFQLIRGATDFCAWRREALAAFAGSAVAAGPAERQANAQSFWDMTGTRFREMVGIEAPDDRTFVVHLERPVPYFLQLCAFPVFYPVRESLVSRYESIDPDTGMLRSDTGWTKPDRIISNGPFRLTRWRYKRDMRMEKNPFHYDAMSLAIDSVDVPSVGDGNAEVLAFETGAVDFVTEVVPPYRTDMLAAKLSCYREHQAVYDALVAQGLDPIEVDRRLPRDPRLNIHALPAFGTYFYSFNCLPNLPDGRPNPFADPRVRRAFVLSVDKRRITEQVRGIGERVATCLIPPGSIPGYSSPHGLDQDVAAARRLLAEAGYPDGSGFITVEILFNKEGGHDVIAQAISKDWQENLGVRVVLQQKETKACRADLTNHRFMVARGSWFGDYGDPTTFLDSHRTGDGNNDRAFSSSEYDALLDRASREADPTARFALLEAAESLLVDQELPILPIFHYSQLYLFDPHRVRGISPFPRQEQNLYQVDMVGDTKGPSESADPAGARQ